MKVNKCKYKNYYGQSLVEFALVLPIILLILLGIVDFGMLFNDYLIITNASREAVRQAVVGATDAQIRSKIADMTSTLEQSRVAIVITPVQASRHYGDEVWVSITYGHNLVTPILDLALPNPITLEAKTCMRME